MYLNGSWLNWETCIQDIGEEDCPLCDAGMSPSYVCVFTVIDHSEFTTKKGVLVKDQIRLLVLKTSARAKMWRQKSRRDGNLVGCRYESTRHTAKECNTGYLAA